LALRQKLAKNPSLAAKTRITKGAADQLALDPFANDPTRRGDYSVFKTIDAAGGRVMKARVRNKRGEYQSIDFDQRPGKDLEASGDIVNLVS
jgi:hypothetical protein